MDEEKKDKDKDDITQHTMRSCCFEMRFIAVVCVARFLISVFVLLLCAYQLIHQLECTYQSLYSGLLGLIIGHWLK